MIDPKIFVEELKSNGTTFFTGVPDSLLKNLTAYVTDNFNSSEHIIAANEGNAIALAAGYHLATEKAAMVYMQNSGLGNTVNPLASLADKEVYNIPMLLVIGWRGEPGIKDEPQHIKQGKITLELLETLQVPYKVLSNDPDEMVKQVKEVYNHFKINGSPYALVVKKGTFSSYTLKNINDPKGDFVREDAIEQIISTFDENTIYVSTTGMISRELFELREKYKQSHSKDFLVVGSMGHTNQIALTIALEKQNREVVCLDGDGSLLMHLGSLAIVGSLKPKNLTHIVLNNGAHDSVGGQPTVARDVDFINVAKALGYNSAFKVENKDELSNVLNKTNENPTFIEVIVKKGNRSNLGRPTVSPIDNKRAFMEELAKE